MAAERIPRCAGDAEKQVHLHPSDTDRQHQSWQHLFPKHHLSAERHLRLPVPMPELNIPQSLMCRPEMSIYIQLFPVLNRSLSMHLPRIARTIPIVTQICWQSSLLSKHGSDNYHSLKWTGFWSVLLSTISGHCKVYFKEYIYMYC